MNPNRFKIHLIVLLILALVVPVLAHAGDEAITCDVKRAKADIDKNGQPYLTVICNESRTLNGVNYVAGVPVTFFGYDGDMPNPGDQLTMIVTKGTYQGKPSYTGYSFASAQ